MSQPAPLREIIKRYGLGARKSLGQHFLLDLNLCARIARAAGDLSGVNVIEIGPGPGGLTRALLDTGALKVVAVERDHRCVEALSELSAAHPRTSPLETATSRAASRCPSHHSSHVGASDSKLASPVSSPSW